MDKCNVLALSGGGYRGLFTVRVLRQLEESMDGSLTDYFDIITGTSIGGIIALGIAAGIPLLKIEDTFKQRGAEIFPQKKWRHLRFGLFRSKYKSDGLRKVLEDMFGDKTMGDLDKAFVIVPSANVTTGKPKMFKTPHANDIFLDATLRVVDVALATSAAPVYFPIHKIEHPKLNARFSDGGLVGNAPGLFGWLEAEEYLGASRDKISLLAVGTLGGSPNISSTESLDKGGWFWISKVRILQFLMSQQEYLSHFMLSRLLGEKYAIIDTTVSADGESDIALDDPSAAAQETLLSRADNELAMFLSTPFFKNHISNSRQSITQKRKTL